MSTRENQRMEKLTVPKLKDLLKQRGLPCKGLKAELVKRILKAEGSGETEGAGAEAGEPEGGAAEDGRKRKAEVLGRGGKRKSKPTHGFISEGSEDNEEYPGSVGEDKTDEKNSREKTDEKDFREENKYFDKIRADGWYMKNLDRYKHSDKSTEELAAEGLNNFKAFKVTLDTELTSDAYTKISSLRESLAESARFYVAVIESAKKVDKVDQFLTAGRNVIACFSHLINYVGPKEAFDITVVAAETITKVCREVPESRILQAAGQSGRRGLLEVWTSLAVNLVAQAGQLQTKEVVSRLEQV